VFNEQDVGPPLPGFPVPVGTGGDITLVDVDFGLRVLDSEMLMLVPLLLSLPPPVTNEAIGPPGKTYSKPGL